MRILALDYGEKRIGVAMSDPTGTIASPFGVLVHKSFTADAETISKLIHENEVKMLVIGVALDGEGEETQSSRRSRKLGNVLKEICQVVVHYVDESYSTNEAREASIAMGKNKRARKGHQDQIAAAIILQRYLDTGNCYA
jgi:putative holliday junction resolvase